MDGKREPYIEYNDTNQIYSTPPLCVRLNVLTSACLI